jgi:hypothetical protein
MVRCACKKVSQRVVCQHLQQQQVIAWCVGSMYTISMCSGHSTLLGCRVTNHLDCTLQTLPGTCAADVHLVLVRNRRCCYCCCCSCGACFAVQVPSKHHIADTQQAFISSSHVFSCHWLHAALVALPSYDISLRCTTHPAQPYPANSTSLPPPPHLPGCILCRLRSSLLLLPIR